MHKKYHSDLKEKNFDVIIIGSGLGGLTTAALLARSGKKVLILERHFVPGGFTHMFKRKHYLWDVGLHYVGQVNDINTALRKAFDYLTDGRLKWAKMDTTYDKAIIGGKEFHFVEGRENQIDELLKHFPQEEKAIRSYFEILKGMSSATPMFFGEKSMPPFLSWFVGHFLRKKFNKLSDKTTYEALKTLTQNEELISVLCAQCGNYGLTPKKSSFAIQALIAEHYLNGGSYPVGGAKEIYEHIGSSIVKNGGEIIVNADVKEILIEKGTAIGVQLQNGDKLFAKKIVSNAGAMNTFTHLISNEDKLLANIRADLQKIMPSSSHICLYVGLNASDEELQLPKNNVWVYKSFDFDSDLDKYSKDPNFDPPLYYISFPSSRDSDWSSKHPNRSTIQVIVPCPYETVKQWQASQWMKRNEDYAEFKNKFEKNLLDKLFELMPQTKDHIEITELSTPLSTRHFTNYTSGEIYGLEHSPQRFRFKWLRPQTPIKNLFLTGQDTLTVGMGGALFSGVVTASSLLKKNFFGKIMKYQSVDPE